MNIKSEKIKVCSIFSGVGGFEHGVFQAVGKESVDVVFSSEIDKYAAKAYEVLYRHKPSGDITKIDAKDVPDHDLLVGGFPCFPAGQKIITNKGFKNIEEIQTGEYVLTHKGRYKEVVTPMKKIYYGDLYEILMKYYRMPIKTTSEHPFFTKRGWIEAKNLINNDYIGFPINKSNDLPVQIKYKKKINQNKEVYIETNLPFEKESFWKLIGYWLAEGWTIDKRKRPQGYRNAYRLIMATTEDKGKFIVPILNDLNIKYNISKEISCDKIHIVSQELWMFIKKFTNGKTASDKFLPEFIQDLPIRLAKALITGYFNGDGNISGYGSYTQFSSTSLSLLEGLQRLLLKTERRLYSLRQSNKAGKTTIEGRVVNAKDCFTLSSGSEQGGCVEFNDDYVFYKIDNISKEYVENLPVYNFEVEEDNSYCLPMTAVHNCQAFSVAGKRQGFEDIRGTLFFEIARIAKEKKPKFMILENVKGLISHDKGKTLEIILETLSEFNYTTDISICNSKYFGVPQNRERIIFVCIHSHPTEEWKVNGNDVLAKAKKKLKDNPKIKTFNFTYPEQKEVIKTIRDILEDDVDEKYYISEEKTRKLIEQLSQQQKDKMCNGSIIDPMAKGIDGLRMYNEISPTLNSRDYKEPRMVVENIYLIDDQGRSNKKLQPLDICPTLRAECHGNEPKVVKESDMKMIGLLDIKGNDSIRRVYSTDGISPTVTTCEGGHREPKVLVEYDRQNGIGKELDVAHTLNASDWRGLNRNQKQNAVINIGNNKGECVKILTEKDEVRAVLTPDREEKRQNGRRFKEDGEPAFTVNTQDKHGVAIGNYPTYRIRKLTPLECFRLQGFPDEYYHKLVEAGISNSQLYKMTGNAVTTNVIEAVFRNLIKYIKEVK